jgi:hypothetical protein
MDNGNYPSVDFDDYVDLDAPIYRIIANEDEMALLN